MDTISFQLYSARNFQPYADVIRTLAALGYRQVEGFGGVFEEAKSLRTLMDQQGLTMPTAHFSIEALENDYQACLAIAKTLGISVLITPWIAPEQRPQNDAGWVAFGQRLQKLVDVYAKEGLTFAWHNHDFEFVPTATGALPQALMLDAASGLAWEVDLGWLLRAKIDHLGFIDRYKDRIIAAHIKDIAPEGENLDEDNWSDVGHGIIDWKPLMHALQAAKARYFVVEHDNPNDFKRFARRSITTVKTF
jgi:sugar phosphate isomerase/epimerase